MKILLVGASGFIGGRLSDYLEKKNFKVTNVSRRNRVNFLKINWNSKKNINNLCKNIDIVINCSGLDIHGSKLKKETRIANSENPLKLFKAANANRVKFFLHLSTYAIYKKTNPDIINEKTKVVGRDMHGLSKIKGAKNLINYPKKKTKLLIIRSCNLFGHPKYKNKNCWRLLINYLIKNITANKPVNILTNKNTYKTYSSIESFCNFFYRLLKLLIKNKKFPTIINYTSNKNYSITDIINLITQRLINKKKLNKKIFFLNKKIKSEKKIKFESLYQRKIKPINDLFFDKEINNLINYCRKF
jgi:nucleoside-diphosphate-sugar epimerase